MKYLLICLLFAPIVYLAIKNKRWYLYLAVAFIGILPEQFSVSIHDKLPLISATRVLILILAVFWVMDRLKAKTFSIPKALLIFGAVNLIISLINLRYGFGEVNRIFLFIFERVLLVIMLKDMITSKEEFHLCIDFMIMGCCALSIIGIMQTVFEYDIASILHLQETATSVSLSSRMGMIRAYGPFNAISFGCYCAFMTLPIYYRLEQTGKTYYSIAFALNIMSLICTFTRSAWLCLGGILLILMILRYRVFFKKILPSIGITVALCLVMCFIQPKLLAGLTETFKSAVNTVLSALPDELYSANQEKNLHTDASEPDATQPETPPTVTTPGFELSEDFGLNANNPTASRMMQWSAVRYLAKDGQLLLGYGYNALLRGKIRFFFENWGNRWVVSTFLDVGLVSLITESGIIGTVSYLALLCYMAVCSLKKRDRTGKFDFYKLTLYIIPMYLLLNFLAAFLFYQIIWLYIGAFFAYLKLNDDGHEYVVFSHNNASSHGELAQ